MLYPLQYKAEVVWEEILQLGDPLQSSSPTSKMGEDQWSALPLLPLPTMESAGDDGGKWKLGLAGKQYVS